MLGSRRLLCHLLAIVATASGLASDLDFIFNEEASPGVEAQPHETILLTEGSLHTLGEAQEATMALGGTPLTGALENVCERTRAVLFTESPGKESEGRLPGAPVYHECMAALAPLRAVEKASNAIDTLSDCMALVNALVKQSQTGAGSGSDQRSPCIRIAPMLEAGSQAQPPSAAKVPPAPVAAAAAASTVAFGAEPTVRAHAAAAAPTAQRADSTAKAALAAQTASAMDLVAEAMTDVCTQTVRLVEADIKEKEDAMKLGNAVSPVCEENARTRLAGVSGDHSQLLREWCHQLDGRLTLALQTGFFFALEPDEAERLAGEANPYATTTRRHFCTRFVDSLRHQAEAGGLYLEGPVPVSSSTKQYLGGPTPVSSSTKPPTAVTQMPKPEAQAAAAPLTSTKGSATIAPPAAEPQPVPSQPSAAASEERRLPAQQAPRSQQTSVDMLHLVQALSHHDEWTLACNSLVSRLTSEEGSVLEEFALGDDETPDGTKVLTFNAADQAELRKCSAQLKVLAVRAGAIVADASTGSISLLETRNSLSMGAELTSETAEAMEALVDSPWSYDACADMAHGFLTAHLAHPDLTAENFCPLYGHDLREMHGRPQESSAEAAKKDLEKLRFMAAKRRSLAHRSQAAATTTSLPVAAAKADTSGGEAKRPNSAFLIKVAAVNSVVPDPVTNPDAGQDKEGLNFWSGMLQD